MQDEINARTGALARSQVADVTLQELKPRPLRRRDQRADLLQVLPLAGREVIQADHPLIQFEQGLQQVRADESGDTGHKPRLGRSLKFSLQLVVSGHVTTLFSCAAGCT